MGKILNEVLARFPEKDLNTEKKKLRSRQNPLMSVSEYGLNKIATTFISKA